LLTREYHLELTLTEDLLGSVPRNKDVYTDYVASKAPITTDTTGESDMVPEGLEEKGWTTFYTDEQGRPCLMDYQLKGFLKEAGNTIKEQLNFKALRSHIDNEVFVFPRRVVLAEEIAGTMERPLRAMTMQGPRVTVVRSDFVKEGTEIPVLLKVLDNSKITEDHLREILEYGALKGLGQWRNGSYGRFTYELNAVA
jgi:hypothetical protein